MAKLNVPVELIEQYISHAKADYVKWTRRGKEKGDEIQEKMIAEFQLSYEVGSSYIKIVQNSHWNKSVHSFIVNKAGKFAIGDVLKAAGWKAPATNFKRATIADKTTWAGRVTWTGVN